MNSTQLHALVNRQRNYNGGFAAAALFLLATGAAPETQVEAPEMCLAALDIEKAHVTGIDASGGVRLADGRHVKLEGLLWPSDAVFQQKAAAALKPLLNREVRLYAGRPRLDRYGRLRAQMVVASGPWLQRDVLISGLARVQIAPDRPECARELYAAEARGRAARAGLWSFPRYAVRSPESLRWRDLGTFQIVEGEVLNVRVSGRAYLNFGRNWRTDFTVTISPDDMKLFRRAGVDPYTYAGRRVRVRGYVDRMNGFEIEVGAPEAVEVLKPE